LVAPLPLLLTHSTNFSLVLTETEATFSFVQVFTACVNSFAHGANDVSNAVGPFAVIYHTWSTGTISTKSSEVPIWQLVAAASLLVVGLATYGYNIMRVLGTKMTLHSPSRGFSMELGSGEFEQLFDVELSFFKKNRLFSFSLSSYHCHSRFPIRSSRLYHHVHHRCHHRSRALQRRPQIHLVSLVFRFSTSLVFPELC